MPAPPMPPEAAKVPPFVSPRLYVSNATIERIGALLQARPSGLMLIVDELAGLFSNMGRYSNGSDREFWLEAWNGKPYSVERVNSSAINLDHLLIGMVGGFQLDKLARAFEGDDDGFYARICFAWPAELSYRPLGNDVDEIEPELVNALTRLIRLSEPKDGDVFVPRTLPLSVEAAETFEQFRQELHEGKQALDGREREWWSKGATRCCGSPAPSRCWNGHGQVRRQNWKTWGVSSMVAAVDIWREYFWPHSRACLRQGGLTKSLADARRLLRWCKREHKTDIGSPTLAAKHLGKP